MKQLLILLICFFISTVAYTTTWEEPWQSEILEAAEYMLLAEVEHCEPTESMQLRVLKAFESDLTGTIEVDDFFMLDLCSSSGEGPSFEFEPGMMCYFLLKKGENGNYQLPTPTSGYAPVEEGEVYATYRHSIHQALVPQDLYELTYGEIWSYYRTQKYDPNLVEPFILRMATTFPAELVEEEVEIFFLQHAALETALHLGVPIDFGLLRGFAESNNFHAQVSALRAMQFTPQPNGPSLLHSFLKNWIVDGKRDVFTKLMALWTLERLGASDALKSLEAEIESISETKAQFEMNLMDPRVCTKLPSPRVALETALNKID